LLWPAANKTDAPGGFATPGPQSHEESLHSTPPADSTPTSGHTEKTISAAIVGSSVVEVAPPTPGSRPGESLSAFPHHRPPKRTRLHEGVTPVKRMGTRANPIGLI
jgi:hypothetical protein